MTNRNSLKAWVAKRGGGEENFDKQKIIESMGCQEGRGGGGGARKILIKRNSLKAWVAKKGGGGGEENFDKTKFIESMGC